MFDEFFRHEKVETIPTFSSRKILLVKSKQTKVRMRSRFLQRIRRWFRLVEIRLKSFLKLRNRKWLKVHKSILIQKKFYCLGKTHRFD